MKRGKHRAEGGSITIEASVSLTIFLFAMISLLFLIRTSRVQAAIQYSLDMAAMDMSQYTYLYYASGLYDLEKDIAQSGEQAAEALSEGTKYLDQSALGVETIFSSIGGAKQNISDAFGQGDVDGILQEFQKQSATLREQGANIGEQLDGLKGLATQIKGDPVSFARSLAALAGTTGLDAVKGRLIGGLFGRAMCEKYIGNGGDADAWLRRMGVKDGLDGLNFNWSNVMGNNAGKDGKDPSQDVDLVVTYSVSVFPGVFSNLEAHFVQGASTRAWLGGDAAVKREFKPLPSDAPQASEPPAQEPEPEETNLWAKENLEKGAAMKALVRQEYSGVGFVSEETGVYGYNAEGNVFYNCSAMDVFSASYQSDSSAKTSIKKRAKDTVEKILGLTELTTDDGSTHAVDPDRSASLELLVVIPENVTETRKQEIQALATAAAQELNNAQTGEGRQVAVSIRVVTGGGASDKGTAGEESQ